MQVELFDSKQPEYMDAFCNGIALRKIMCQYYDSLVKEKQIIPIEDLDEAYKRHLKESAIEISAGRLDIPGLVQLCKCLQVFTFHKTSKA
jgi:hypothetical protein